VKTLDLTYVKSTDDRLSKYCHKSLYGLNNTSQREKESTQMD